MYLAYLDESGDTGLYNSPTTHFVLACVLVHESKWFDTLDLLVTLRRNLRSTYGIPTRPEIKASDFRRAGGPLRDLRWSRQRRSASISVGPLMVTVAIEDISTLLTPGF